MKQNYCQIQFFSIKQADVETYVPYWTEPLGGYPQRQTLARATLAPRELAKTV